MRRGSEQGVVGVPVYAQLPRQHYPGWGRGRVRVQVRSRPRLARPRVGARAQTSCARHAR
eukprot:4742450-Pyramimonas_sp.AAC.1